ncbi:MAG: hypothetical protein GTN89_12080 [Acidobacteria bacterium]|nr:hypothetical protein [Acidobacteriota bacterium]NIM63462.1 hypothetical protein [Acidobacteriota bacterium]NIO60890.1 hypothetical protein [Acidobacteriota bacterium]NIQ31082.1 hypothetical protein [Acidobacteriota bacterium]NIQ87351.1 hypothetical protein [Acidobacteriota bacterium]
MTKSEKAGTQQAQTTPSTDDLRTACEIHTLAQMVYSQFHTPNPWMHVAPPQVGYTHVAPPQVGYTHQAAPTMPDPRMAPVWGWPQVWRY